MNNIPPVFFKTLFEKHNQNYDRDWTNVHFVEGDRHYDLKMKRRFTHDNRQHQHQSRGYDGLPRYANAVYIHFEIVNKFWIELYFLTSHPPVVRTDEGPEINPQKLLNENVRLFENTTMEDVEHLLMLAALSEDITFDYIP